MIRRPPRSTLDRSSAASDVYKRQILVTLAEATPISQASELQEDLRRAKIEPYAWVLNCLLYTSPSPRDRTRSRMPSSA